MDVEDITPGADFTQAIDRTVGNCDVLVAVIGPRWLELLRARLGPGRDFVSQEIATALQRNVTVIPVLVAGAAMPRELDLPSELTGLARRQAVVLRDEEFARHADDLVRAIRRTTAGGRSSRRLAWLLVGIGVLIAIAGSTFFLLNSRERASLNGMWIARLQRPGSPSYNIRLRLQEAGGVVTGGVQYPTGNAAVQQGTLRGRRLAFFTRHTPQFESEPAVIQFQGMLRGREIDLTVTLPDGAAATGVARKSD